MNNLCLEYYRSIARTGKSFTEKLPFVEKIISIGDTINAKIVVDFGCGKGTDVRILQKMTDWNIIGVDFCSEMLECLPDEIEKYCFDVGKPIKIKTPVCDIAYCSSLIHLLDIEGKRTLFTNAYNMLRKGGIFLVLTSSHDDLKRRFISKYFPSAFEIDKIRYLSVEKITEMMFESGFLDVSNECLYLGHFDSFANLGLYEQKRISILTLISESEFLHGLSRMKEDNSQETIRAKYSSKECKRTLIIGIK